MIKPFKTSFTFENKGVLKKIIEDFMSCLMSCACKRLPTNWVQTLPWCKWIAATGKCVKWRVKLSFTKGPREDCVAFKFAPDFWKCDAQNKEKNERQNQNVFCCVFKIQSCPKYFKYSRFSFQIWQHTPPHHYMHKRKKKNHCFSPL